MAEGEGFQAERQRNPGSKAAQGQAELAWVLIGRSVRPVLAPRRPLCDDRSDRRRLY